MEKNKEYFRKYYLNHREQMIKNAIKSYLENRYKNKSVKREYNRLYYEQRGKYNKIKNPMEYKSKVYENKLKSYDNKLKPYEYKSRKEIPQNKKLENIVIVPEKIIISTHNIIVEL